jgi:hypothetical protein
MIWSLTTNQLLAISKKQKKLLKKKKTHYFAGKKFEERVEPNK